MQVIKGWSFLSCSFAALCAVACGSVTGDTNTDGNTINPNGDFTLSVDPTSLTIPIASSAKVTVTVHRTDLTGDIALSATGLGTNLTADFSPAVIPNGTDTSEVTITVKGGTAAGTSTVSLTGTLGDKTHSADVSVTSQTITVSGIVRGGRAGIKVGLVGKTTQTSGAGGIFTFTDVTPPYDLYTFENFTCTATNVNTPTVYYFDDLTVANPTVTAAAPCNITGFFILCGILGNPCPSAPVSGSKTGVGNNTDPIVWAWTGGNFNSPVVNSNSTYSGNASWSSGTTSQGFLHALQMTRKTNGAPNTFLGYARSAQTTLTKDTGATINLNFTTVNSVATVTGTLMGPPGYPDPHVQLMQQFGTSVKPLWDTTTTAIDAAFPTGLTLAGDTSLFASSTLNGGTSYFTQSLPATTTVNFTMPEAAVATLPAESATGVTTATPFEWTAPSNVVTDVWINSNNSAAYHVFTTAKQLTIPVVPELPLPAAKSFTWTIYGYGPTSSINDAAGANELEQVFSADFSGPAHAFTIASTRSFTTP